MSFVVWGSAPLGNACLLEPLENTTAETSIDRGISCAAKFPADALMRMTQRHKKNTALLDDVASFTSLKVCSPRLVDFLQGKQLKNVEYLPISILDHKGAVASKGYCIVNPINPQDALDSAASEAKYNAIRKQEIRAVSRLALLPDRLDPEIQLFRLKNLIPPILLDKSIADEMQAMGFKGMTFTDPGTYRL